MTTEPNIEAIVEKVKKLLNLAGKNSNEAEAASATAKAMQLLAAYNLDMATIEQGGGESGKREEARLMGGMYIYERELWSAIAELNFCMYFTTRQKSTVKSRKISFAHRIIGRTVNTVGTKAMADYIQGTIARLCRDRFPQNNQFFLREAVAFREGMADKIVSRLNERRRSAERAEADKKAEMASKAGQSGDTRFALTIADVKKTEEAANYDFLHGEGAWQRREDGYEEWNRAQAARREARAKADAEAEAAYAQWAAANPEEAAADARKAEAERKKKEKAQERSWNRRSYRSRQPTARERRQGSDYYDAGYEKGSSVSLEPQVDSREGQRRITK
jgi:hypothetical protein